MRDVSCTFLGIGLCAMVMGANLNNVPVGVAGGVIGITSFLIYSYVTKKKPK